ATWDKCAEAQLSSGLIVELHSLGVMFHAQNIALHRSSPKLLLYLQCLHRMSLVFSRNLLLSMLFRWKFLMDLNLFYSFLFRKIPPAADSPMPSPAAHVSTPFPASVLQPFSNPSAVYIPSTPISSRITSSYIMTSAMLSNAAFVTTSDTNSIMSHTTAFPHMAASLSIMDSTFKAPSAVSPVPAVIPSPSHKPSKTKTSKSSKVKDLSSRSDESSSNKKKKPQSSSSSLSLQTSSSSSFSGSHKKNCVLNTSSTLNSYQATSSYNSMSVHNTNNGTSPLSAKLEPSGRTSLSSSSTDSVKHMSMVVSSIDSSNLSVPSLVHHSGDHSLGAHNAVSSSKACKITKMPGMNSVHRKSTANLISAVPDPTSSSISRQVRDPSGYFFAGHSAYILPFPVGEA
uniref:Ataxin 7 like 1 n=1 Tax=Meleagris gallopavo TaxID=9103 RepID=G1N4P2_MELGA